MRIGSRRFAISSFKLRIQCRRAVLLSPQRLQLKAQVNAPEVLKNVEQEKHRYDSAQPAVLLKILLPGRLRVAHQTRIINPLHRSEFPHRHCLLFLHVNTLAAAKRPALFPRKRNFALLDRGFARSSSSLGRTTCFVKILSVPCLARFAKCFFHDPILPGSDTPKRRTAPLDSLWRDPRKKLPEFLHLSIHRYPQRQKRFCRGMQSLPSPLRSDPATTFARCAVSLIGRALTIDLAILLESLLVRFTVQQIGQLFLWATIHNLVCGQLTRLRTKPRTHSPRLLPCACSADLPGETKIPLG